MSFSTLGLDPSLLSAVQKAGFTTPTAVQKSAIPEALNGHDLMVSSQTGSGKTAAFMLAALNRIISDNKSNNKNPLILVLTPTRELAMQIASATKVYGAHMRGLNVATVVGGMPYGAQIKALSRRVDVLVATPGRLIDHINARRINLGNIQTLVLDEADRMLDMGFIDDINSIVSRTPATRQTLLFSATLDASITKMAASMLNNPKTIQIAQAQKQHSNITQSLLYADDTSHKMRLLDHLLRDHKLDQAIVFTATKRGADSLASRLSEQGFAAAALHGDMNQRQRTRTLGMLQKKRLQILVATDVAARGIDVEGISHAFNYDLPMQAEDYVHRIGRTGRAGRSGKAYTLAVHSERHKVRRIEKFIGRTIDAETIDGLEPTAKADAPRKRPSRSKNKGSNFRPGKANPAARARKSNASRTGSPSRSGNPSRSGGPSRNSKNNRSRAANRSGDSRAHA